MLAQRQPSFKQCVTADSSSDVAPKMIGDQTSYRSDGLVESSDSAKGRGAFRSPRRWKVTETGAAGSEDADTSSDKVG